MVQSVPFDPSEAALEPARNLAPEICDLLAVFSRACDLAADEAVARGVALSLLFDPALRAPRSVRVGEVAAGARAMIGAMLRLADRGALSVRGGLDGDEATVSVSGPLHHNQLPDLSVFGKAAAHAKMLDGRLEVEQRAGRLILSMVFPAPGARPSVLLVEEEWPRRHETVRRLGDAGFEVVTAEDGETALRLIRSSIPSAVMIDLFLEAEDALALSRTLRTASGAPVLALTRQGRSVSGWALKQAGFSGVLENPIDPQALKAAIAAARSHSAGARSVEAAELDAVQDRKNGQEDGDDEKGDHVLRSAVG